MNVSIFKIFILYDNNVIFCKEGLRGHGSNEVSILNLQLE